MNTNRTWIAMTGALACALSAAGTHAQTAQTAEGAQRFLAAVARKGHAQAWFVDANGKTNRVTGVARTTSTAEGLLGNDESRSEATVEKELSTFVVTELDTQAADGSQDACLTRIAKWEIHEPLQETRTWSTTDEGVLVDTSIQHHQTVNYQVPPELAAPHWIDWRNVKIGRSKNGATMAALHKEKNFVANLAFSGEGELVDRIEYAMKFLKMSCDDTAATGF